MVILDKLPKKKICVDLWQDTEEHKEQYDLN